MSNGPIKTFYLKGNLRNNVISTTLYPISEYSQGRWNFCVSQMIYHIKQDNIQDEICGLSTNFIKSTKFTSNNQIETIYQILNVFLIQGKLNQKKVINFEKTWSLINNFSEELKIYVNSLPRDQIVNEIDCDIYILILLQRIQ